MLLLNLSEKFFKNFACIALFASAGHNIIANNIALSNVVITGQNTSAGVNNVANFSVVQFNLSWSNSWRVTTGPANWDAAWLFVKFRVGSSNSTFTGVSSIGFTVTVSSTANLRVGMPVRVTGGNGEFATNTVISSITNATQFVVSALPSTTLSNATIECVRIWEHARLNNAGHTAPTGSTIDAGLLTPGTTFDPTTNPAVGVFIYRNAAGTGLNTFSNIQLRWNYGANGVGDDMSLITVQVFAIEMVHVPEGNFFVGSGGTELNSFTQANSTSGNTVPFQITSSPPTLQGNNASSSATNLSARGNLGLTGTNTASLAPEYPTGFNAFYCMKYEISQGQYRDFLNTLTRSQQANRVTMDGTVGRYAGGFTWNGSTWSGSEINNLTTPANRNGLRLIADPGGISPRTYACDLNPSTNLPTGVNQSDDGEWIAMSQLTWMDGCAYLDWAGLRPMTELEFEKACRGNQAPVSNEFAWGNATTTSATNITNGGQAGEITSTPNANSVSTMDVSGPLRVGVFARTTTSRAQAGATYYGIMEMSGNLLEGVVNVVNPAGRSYRSSHGDGNLFRDGSANVNYWPGINGNFNFNTANTVFQGTTGITATAGSGMRGSSWVYGVEAMRVSNRNDIDVAVTSRNSFNGFRGVRTSP